MSRWTVPRGTTEMSAQERRLLDWVQRLEETGDNAGHPLMEEFRTLAAEHRKLMRQLTKIATISDRMHTDSRQMAQVLHAAAQTDPLTQLPNRRHMIERLESELGRIARHGGSFTLVMVDIDHFKAINDAFGHAVGDTALVETARILRQNLRGHDLCARWGGEEFLILLTETDQEQAKTVAEKLRRLVDDHRMRVEGRDIHITLSLGIAAHRPDWTADACIQAADDALYAAKRAGRNRWAA
ncbi:diguanylate cyclase (GGDEF)-like protein [Azospirillum agricola]|uniref:diguanylate cyclase n=1 Tax=Azospirillum agricola TaxID=1720247 RepID=UPI001AE1FE75|nr:diguanylate cyclase [Azospirillum agricola]MBP2231472.1 diguanylate cyclase (GGDEF)-like protein [Azospirillum agricola]